MDTIGEAPSQEVSDFYNLLLGARMPQVLWLGCVGGTYEEATATWEEEEELPGGIPYEQEGTSLR